MFIDKYVATCTDNMYVIYFIIYFVPHFMFFDLILFTYSIFPVDFLLLLLLLLLPMLPALPDVAKLNNLLTF